MSKNDAIWTYLTDLKHSRQMRKLFFDRVDEEPEKAQQYLSRFTQDQIDADPILKDVQRRISST